jgi:hypothetical protein
MKKIIITFSVMLMLVLASCTATFNWREVKLDEQQFFALFPAKHHFEQQTFRFEKNELTMTMVASKAGDILFAIGAIPFDAKVTSEKTLTDWMKSNVAKIVQGKSEQQLIQFEVKTAGTPALIIPAQGYNLKGFGPDGVYRIYWVRWVVRQKADGQSFIYQMSAIQSFKAEPTAQIQKQTTEQIETFMGGFHPY